MATFPDYRTDSPVGSAGRASPANLRLQDHNESDLFKRDKAFRRWAVAVERILLAFDQRVEEWADYISFLGRLQKLLQAKPPDAQEIPHKTVVAKRLAQCLAPSLPSGVHQKALEVYSDIFSITGTEGLSKDLGLYLQGLAPIVSFASLSVKPLVLEIFERHIVKLDPNSIRPALKSLILALLPALEEDGTDEFDRASSILATLKDVSCKSSRKLDSVFSTGDGTFFWNCVFLASITNPSRRPGALAYLSKHLPSLKEHLPGDLNTFGDGNGHVIDVDAVLAVSSPEPGLLIRCFCTGLQDKNVLIQRGFLDLLCEKFPISCHALQGKARKEDVRRLVMSATSVVLRRDLSLNRRLWTWFMGSAASTEKSDEVDKKQPSSGIPLSPSTPNTAQSQAFEIAYFRRFGLERLVEGLHDQLSNSKSSPDRITQTLRICLALMDRGEIGNAVLPFIFTPAIKSVFSFYLSEAPKSTRNEVVRSGSVFFDSVESMVIWTEIIQLIRRSFQDPHTKENEDNLPILVLLLTKFNLKDEEMHRTHLPLVTAYLVMNVSKCIELSQHDEASHTPLLTHGLRAAAALMQQIPATSLALAESTSEYTSQINLEEGAFLSKIQSFYSKDALSIQRERLVEEAVCAILSSACTILGLALADPEALSYEETETAVMLFDLVLRKITLKHPAIELVTRQFHPSSSSTLGSLERPFKMADVLIRVSILEVLQSSRYGTAPLGHDLLRNTIPELVESAWCNLTSSRSRHHVEASNALWRLHGVCDADGLVESCISSIGAHALSSTVENAATAIEFCSRFIILWQQSQSQSDTVRNRQTQNTKLHQISPTKRLQLCSRPLMQLLEHLLGYSDEVSVFIAHWLEYSAELPLIVNIVFSQVLKSTELLTQGVEKEYLPTSIEREEELVDLQTCVYFLRVLTKVLEAGKRKLEDTLENDATDEPRQLVKTKLEVIAYTCLRTLRSRHPALQASKGEAMLLKHSSLTVLENLMPLLSLKSVVDLNVHLEILRELRQSIDRGEQATQLSLTKLAGSALHLFLRAKDTFQDASGSNPPSGLAVGHTATTAREELPASSDPTCNVPPLVTECVMAAFCQDMPSSLLSCWLLFLDQVLPLYGTQIFSVLMPLSQCFCKVLTRMLDALKGTFTSPDVSSGCVDESSVIIVLNALERLCENAHGTLSEISSQSDDMKQGQSATGFFNMVSAIASEGTRAESKSENDRLTVLICFKDSLKVCFDIWSFDESSVGNRSEESTTSSSLKYTILRLRNRTRRIAEHLFQAQGLECLEALVALWHQSMLSGSHQECGKILGFITSVEAARPKITIPALFNAIYSRTHPAALDPERRSSLTTDIREVSLAEFLIQYIRSLEDDAVEEIWSNCLTFLRDVLTSPLNHRQILVQLLQLVTELGTKIDKTNFGEQRKMRRELGDLFIRLLSAITTLKPSGTGHEKSERSPQALVEADQIGSRYKALVDTNSADLIQILAAIFPRLSPTLLEHDRMSSISSQISTQIIVPAMRARGFPENISRALLELLMQIGLIPEASRTYKKDVGDAFTDVRFFAMDANQAKAWLPILRQWAVGDKDRLPDLFGRLSAPTAAGLMFGVGASSARAEADRRSQLILRRIAILLVAGPFDAFVINLPGLTEKLTELLNANSTSSPSSATRAEIYMVIRAMLLCVSPGHLSTLWPILNTEISSAILSIIPGRQEDSLSPESTLQLCKLIDTLLVLNLDDFQLHEWLLITDDTDAVYASSQDESAALADIVAGELGTTSAENSPFNTEEMIHGKLRKPFLTHSLTQAVSPKDYMECLIRPFLSQLSIRCFEGVYNLQNPDADACISELVEDLFNDSSLA